MHPPLNGVLFPMKKFAFIFPAKIVFAEKDIVSVVHEFMGFKFHEFVNENVYFNTKKEKVVREVSSFSSFYIETNGILHYIHSLDNAESFRKFLEHHGKDKISMEIEDRIFYIENPEVYSEFKEKEISERKARIAREREEADELCKEREKQRAAALEDQRSKTLSDYKEGETVKWEDLSFWFEKHDLLPPRTKGWANKFLETISKNGSCTLRGTGKVSSGFSAAFHKFNKTLES